MRKLLEGVLLGAALTMVAPAGAEAQELTIEPVKDGLYTIFGPRWKRRRPCDIGGRRPRG